MPFHNTTIWHSNGHFIGKAMKFTIEVSAAMEEDTLFKQHQKIVEDLRTTELAQFFRKLVHDFLSSLGGVISGVDIISAILPFAESTDEQLAIDLNANLLPKSQATIFKTSVDIKLLISTSIVNNLAISDYFSVKLNDVSTAETLTYYCDATKLSIVINKFLYFLFRQYQYSTIDIFADYHNGHYRCLFQLKDNKVKPEHQEFIDKGAEINSIDEGYDLEFLSEIRQLLALNIGQLGTLHAGKEHVIEEQLSESFFLNLMDNFIG